MPRKELKIRLPEDLKAWVEAEAAKNMRPMNAEIVLALQAAKDRDEAKNGALHAA